MSRGLGAPAPFLHHMEINHCGGHITVPHKILHGANIDPALKQVRGKTVPERMTTDPLGNRRSPDRILESSLHGFLMQVVTGNMTCPGMGTQLGSSEYKLTRCLHPASRSTGFAALRPKDLRPLAFLPRSLFLCVWIFAP